MWVLTTTTLFEVRVDAGACVRALRWRLLDGGSGGGVWRTAEDRNVWRLHLEREEYDQALTHCSSDAQRDMVRTAQVCRDNARAR